MTTTPELPSHDHTPLKVPPLDAPEPPTVPTVLDSIRASRNRQAMQRRRVFVIPGLGGQVGVRMQSGDADGVLQDVIRMLVDDGDPVAADDRQCQMIARACVEVLVRDDDAAEWKPAAEEIADGLGPVRFDERLVKRVFGLDSSPRSATEIVRTAIPYKPNRQILHAELVQWLGEEDPDERLDELVGESSAASR